MKRFKHKGVTLAATAIAIVAWMFLGYISFIVMASPFSVLAAVRIARQAEQYAEFVANSLKLVDYSELGSAAHARRSLTGEISGAAGWESSIAMGAEHQIGANPDNLQRIATVDIFRSGDTLSRYTLQVPLSSASGSSNYFVKNQSYKAKVSLELAYDSKTDSIRAYANGVEKSFYNDSIGVIAWSTTVPDGWLVCNGQTVSTAYPKLRKLMTKTPNLLGYYIKAYSSSESVGKITSAGSISLYFDGEFPTYRLAGRSDDWSGIRDHKWLAAIYEGADGHAVNYSVRGWKTFNATVEPTHINLIPIIKAK